MWPFLFDLDIAGVHLKPPTYGVLLAIAFSAGYFEALRRSKPMGLEAKHVENIFLLVVLSSVIGARMFHVLFEDPSYYWQHPTEIIAIWNGGYTLYGALILSLVCGVIYTRLTKINYLAYADLAATSVALGIGIGRLGCFFAGCCWGAPTKMPWGVTFSHPESFTDVHLKHIPLHPTQIYESIGCFLIYGYISWLAKRHRYQGQLIFHFLIAYSFLRYLVEIFRGDTYRGFVLGGVFSYSQFISLSFVPIALLGIWYCRKHKPLN